jgi:hypothetical protein
MSGQSLVEATRWYRMDDGYLGWGDWSQDEYVRYVRALLCDRNAGWPEETRSAIIRGEVREGMTRTQVKASWGPPHRYDYSGVRRSVESSRWIYGWSPYTRELYFDGETLIRIEGEPAWDPEQGWRTDSPMDYYAPNSAYRYH